MSNTDIPASAREFGRWMNDVSHEWPPELRRLGINARMSFDFLDQPDENRSPRTNEMALHDLIAFVEAYTHWTANGKPTTGNPVSDASTTGH